MQAVHGRRTQQQEQGRTQDKEDQDACEKQGA
jgi:hypothetical protein